MPLHLPLPSPLPFARPHSPTMTVVEFTFACASIRSFSFTFAFTFAPTPPSHHTSGRLCCYMRFHSVVLLDLCLHLCLCRSWRVTIVVFSGSVLARPVFVHQALPYALCAGAHWILCPQRHWCITLYTCIRFLPSVSTWGPGGIGGGVGLRFAVAFAFAFTFAFCPHPTAPS